LTIRPKRSVGFEYGVAFARQGNGAAIAVLDLHEAGDDGILPHRKLRASAAPGIHDVGIAPRPVRNPGQELQRDKARWLGHGIALVVCVHFHRPARSTTQMT
jgi:hypothetical protein